MDFMEEFGKYKHNAANIVLIVVSLVIANNIYGMQSKNKTLLNDKIREETERNNVLTDISRSEKHLDSLKKLVNKKELGSVINNIHTLARENAVSVMTLKPQSERPSPDYIKYPYELSVSGMYHKIGKFISKLESSPDIYVVDSLNIHPAPESKDKSKAGLLNAEIKFSTLKIKD